MKIPYGRQNITDEDINEVVEVLKSDFLTQGPKIPELEKKFSNYINSKYSIAVNNGTSALYLASVALQVNSSSNIITTPITFSATANAFKIHDANIHFVDIDRDTYLIDYNLLEKKLKSKPKGFFNGIIVVDFAGRCVNLEKFYLLAKKYGCWLVEDACHAPGASFINSKNKKHLAGDGFYADISIFSMHPVKHIASGEGGIVTTRNEKLYKKMIQFRNHGITRNNNNFKNNLNIAWGNDKYMKKQSYPLWYMELQSLGLNFRLTDIQASLAISQLKRAKNGILKRRQIARKYISELSKISEIKIRNLDIENHAFHLFVIEIDERSELYYFLRNNGIYCQIHYFPLHLMPLYKKNNGFKLVNAEDYYSKCLSLPMFPSIKEFEINFVINKILEFYDK